MEIAGTILLAVCCTIAGSVIGFVCAALCVAAGREDRDGIRADDAE